MRGNIAARIFSGGESMTGGTRFNRRTLMGGALGLGAMTAMAKVAPAEAAARPSARLPRRGEFVVRGVIVLSMDDKIGDLATGDIHVRNGVIVAVARSIPAPPGVEIIPAHGMIALPGLIDTHFHTWNSAARNLVQEGPTLGYFPLVLALGKQCTPEDIYRGVRLGTTELLYGGVTTLNDWAHNIRSPDYAEADIQALADSGMRARFSYGYWQGGPGRDETIDLADLARLKRDWSRYAHEGLLSLGYAARSFSSDPTRGLVTFAAIEKEWVRARELQIPITIHASAVAMISALDDAKMLGPDVQLINSCAWDAPARERVLRSGALVSVSPFSEMRASFALSPVVEMLKLGIPLSLAIDTPAIAGNSDMFSNMHTLIDTQFVHAGNPSSITARQVLEMATIGGARGLGIADRTGSLTPGKRADLILVHTTDLNMAPLGDPTTAIVRSAQPYNVDTVVVDGRILKRHRQMTAVDPAKVVAAAAESLATLKWKAGFAA
jgi:5-methylthioadenosine/S-adenosylhomocysteine deaminase